MVRLSPEAKVGLFVLLGIILLVYMSLKVGGIRFGRGEGYDVAVRFDNVGGLDKDAPVRVAGVEVGRVKDIRLEDNVAKVTLRINPQVELGKDFTAIIKTQGLLGERYIELIPGAPGAPPLQPGDEITRTTTYADFDRLIAQLSAISGDVKQVTESLSKVLGGDKGEATLRNIVMSIEELSANLNRGIAANDEKFDRMMTNLEAFSKTLKDDSPEITRNLKLAARGINKVIDENRDNLKASLSNLNSASKKLEDTLTSLTDFANRVQPKLEESITSIQSVTAKIDRGDGTIGRLVNDKATVENLNEALNSITEFTTKVQPRLESAFASLQRVADKIDKGEGTMGRLVNDKTTVENLNKALNSITEFTTKVQPRLEETAASLQRITRKIESGEGTIGKLVTDDTTIKSLNKTLSGVDKYITQGERFKTFIGVRGEYLFDVGDSKNYVTLRIQPRSDKYYLLEIIDDPRNRVQFDKLGRREPADKVLVSAQIAKRFYNFTIRGGMIESKGGIGFDYHLFDDRLKLTFEASDFDEERRPFLKAAATYKLGKYFFLTGGYSDIISKYGLESPFIGVGLRFEDEDIKYLLLNAPKIR